MQPVVSVSELKSRLEAGSANTVVVDCRFALADPAMGERNYSDAHIPGAFYAHLDRDLSSPVRAGITGRHPLPDLEVFAAKAGALGIGEGVTVVAYDDGPGAFAARLWWLLRYLGHDDVAVLDGGMAAWLAAGEPVSVEVPVASPRKFASRVQSEMVVDAEFVERFRVSRGSLLWDARAADRFRGENETIDPVPGHIAGATSLPFPENLKEGKFRSPAELAARFASALAGAKPSEAVTYCGSGVTACHNVLAAERAGYPGVRLYAGSYSEWIVDRTRPVRTGNE